MATKKKLPQKQGKNLVSENHEKSLFILAIELRIQAQEKFCCKTKIYYL